MIETIRDEQSYHIEIMHTLKQLRARLSMDMSIDEADKKIANHLQELASHITSNTNVEDVKLINHAILIINDNPTKPKINATLDLLLHSVQSYKIKAKLRILKLNLNDYSVYKLIKEIEACGSD